MLACEVGDLQKDLTNARRNIQTLVRMHTDAAKDRDALSLEVMSLKRQLSERRSEKLWVAKAR
jgi:regulator of replication initiation timing